MSSTANRVIKNTGYLYAKMGITMFISLYTTRLILRSLGASDFGIFNIVGGAISMLGFLNGAMASATQRFMSYSEGEGDKEKQKIIFNVSFVLHLIISFIVGFVLLMAGYFFFNKILNIPENRVFAAEVVYCSLIISTMFTVMTVPYDAVMNAHENMKYYAIVGVFESLLKLSVALVCVYTSHDKLIVYGILMACIPFITLTIMRIYCHKNYNECIINPKRYWDKGVMKEITIFAGWNFSSFASNMIGNYGIGIVLNIFFGTIINAAQGIATQISGQLSVFTSNMLKALNPVIYKSAGANNNKLSQDLALSGCKFSFLIIAFFALPLIIETPYILRLWLNDVPQYAVIFTQLQIIRIMIEQLTVPLIVSVSATGKIKKISFLRTIINIIPIPLIYFLFKLGSPPYIVYIISIIIWGIIGGIINIYFAKKNKILSIKEYIFSVLLPCLCIWIIILICGYILTKFQQENIYRIVLTIFISTFLFIILSFSVVLTQKEKYIFFKILNVLRNKL